MSSVDLVESSIPTTPWDFADLLGISLPERPMDLGDVLIDEEDRTAVQDAAEVSADDYDGVEQYLFTKIKKRVRSACNVNTQWPQRNAALRWIFESMTEDREGTNFRMACQALGARHIVLQTRLQYQLYRAGVPLPEPLNILSDSLPETVAGEVLLHGSMVGLDLAREVWRWPGIRADLLRERMTDLSIEQFQAKTRALEDSGHLGLKHGCWFFISRNPDIISSQGRRRFSWARSFFGDR